jgi:CheY-like chemotaxis protein
LLNYVANAVKFTDMGAVSVGVTCLKETPNNGALLLRFEVRDSGIGIAADRVEQLFRPFEQANASTTRQYGGSGLGLAITARLAKLMDGEVGVNSESGVGSAFWFTARLERGQAPEASHSSNLLASEDAATVLARDYAHAKVLVVDDDMFNREVACELLQSLGLRTEAANDGFDAVSQASLQHFDAILMDVQMPLINGLDATRRIRALPGWESTPILALTANAYAQDAQACMDAGMNDFVAKPINPPQLYATLLLWLSKQTADIQ